MSGQHLCGALGTFILTVHCGGMFEKSATIDDIDTMIEEFEA